MSQASSSTQQVCEVLVESYRDREQMADADDPLLQKNNVIDAPFKLLRRPSSGPKDAGFRFQFGKAQKANLDFVGKRKGMREDGKADRADHEATDIQAGKSGESPIQAAITRVERSSPLFVEDLQKGTKDPGPHNGKEQSVFREEHSSAQSESIDLVEELINSDGLIDPQDPSSSDEKNKAATTNESLTKKTPSPPDTQDQSPYFASPPRSQVPVHSVNLKSGVRKSAIEQNMVTDSNSDRAACSHSKVRQPTSNLIDRSLAINEHGIAESSASNKNDFVRTRPNNQHRFEKYSLTRPLRKASPERKVTNGPFPQTRETENGKAKIKVTKPCNGQKHFPSGNKPKPARLQEAISRVVEESYTRQLKDFEAEREHFTAQIAALKVINANLNTNFTHMQKTHERSSQKLAVAHKDIATKAEQIEDMKRLSEGLKLNLDKQRALLAEVTACYACTKEELNNAKIQQKYFEEHSEKILRLTKEMRHAISETSKLKITNEHLNERLEEKNKMLEAEKERFRELDGRLQMVAGEHDRATGSICLQMQNVSEKLESLQRGARDADEQFTSRKCIAECLQAVQSLHNQQTRQSGYIQQAGIHLEILMKRFPNEIRRLEQTLMGSDCKQDIFKKIDDQSTGFRSELANLKEIQDQYLALSEEKSSLKQMCCAKETEVAKLQKVIEAQTMDKEQAIEQAISLKAELSEANAACKKKDIDMQNLKEIEMARTALQADLMTVREEHDSLNKAFEEKSFTEKILQSQIEGLKADKQLLEDEMKRLQEEKSAMNIKNIKKFDEQKNNHEEEICQLTLNQVRPVERRLHDSEQNGRELQDLLRVNSKELDNLKELNKHLEAKLASEAEKAQKSIDDLESGVLDSQRIESNRQMQDIYSQGLTNLAKDLLNEKIIDDMKSDKEEAKRKAESLTEELCILRQTVIENKSVQQKLKLELVELKKNNTSLRLQKGESEDTSIDILKQKDGIKDNSQVPQRPNAARNFDQETGNCHDYQNDYTGNITSGPQGAEAHPVDESIRRCSHSEDQHESTNTCLNCKAQNSSQCECSAVLLSGQWPQLSQRNVPSLCDNPADNHHNHELTNLCASISTSQDKDVVCPYFQRNDASTGLTTTPSLFKSLTYREASRLQEDAISSVPYSTSKAKPKNEAIGGEDIITDTQLDVRTFSDINNDENTAVIPSSISPLSEINIPTPEELLNKTDISDPHKHESVSANGQARPNSSNMSARRKPIEISSPHKGSDASSENVRNVGPEDVFRIERKRPHPNTASKLTTNLFRNREESHQADRRFVYNDTSNNGDRKKRRIDQPPFLLGNFSKDDFSTASAGVVQTRYSQNQEAGTSNTRPRIRRILNWASMYSGAQQRPSQAADAATRSTVQQQSQATVQHQASDRGKQSSIPRSCLKQSRNKPLADRKGVLVERSLTPQEVMASVSLAPFQRHRQSATQASRTTTKSGVGRRGRRRVSKNDRYSFRFSSETTKK